MYYFSLFFTAVGRPNASPVLYAFVFSAVKQDTLKKAFEDLPLSSGSWGFFSVKYYIKYYMT